MRLYGTDLRDRIAAAGLEARVEHMGARLAPERCAATASSRPAGRPTTRASPTSTSALGQGRCPAAELTAQPSVWTSRVRTSSRETSRFSTQSRVTASTKPIQPRTASCTVGVRSPPASADRVEHALRVDAPVLVDDGAHLGVAADAAAQQRGVPARVLLDVAR